MFGELIAWYLFFGGMAGGACLAGLLIKACASISWRKAGGAALASSALGQRHALVWRQFHDLVGRPTLIAATLAAAVGSICLLGDMVRPEQAHLLFIRPVFSVLNVGALALALFLVVLIALLAIDLRGIDLSFRVLVALKVLAGALACVIIVYTGIYLNSIWTIVPWSSAFLVPLFLFSSLATGLAVPFLVVGISNVDLKLCSEPLKVLARLDAVCIAGEMISLIAMFIQMGGLDEQSPFALFFSDGLGLPFLLGFIGCGILAPLLLDALSLRARVIGPWHVLVLGFTTMIGGYFLRYCVMGVSVVFRAMTIAAIGV
ncbi:NrfD/PsrC family molybdoenzyme membrane anchor subunit [Adlercreutzia sp. R7]|uniref:NrfD/PsrC family molybdoenzyme membrane anchor subunit n=1 Tax=Adlercreutzia wanghongyangiae TaxID=3111451 RepID=A0ABU6IFA0_9ACTN|nr:NrfD/PsrC family molybdoenzyme membrane anchor subunit [Adlercreutzia sp. R7]